MLSFGSFGEVDTQGVEVNLDAAVRQWRFGFGLSYFDYEIALEAAENPLAPNRPVSTCATPSARSAAQNAR